VVWTVLHFGKHRGKTLPQIVLSDPDWFFWALKADAFKKPSLKEEAKAINYKTRRIKIQPDPSGLEVEYIVHPSVGKLGAVHVVPEDRPPHHGSSPTYRSKYFDLSMPRQIAQYDKTGGTTLLKAIKTNVFRNVNIRFTRERCEAFFDDEDNFG
jgi:hypothetical protein